MAYTVTKVAKLSGVSVRTLHYYDEVGLLKPAFYGSNGYRYYEEEQLLTLQQILFFRELGLELAKIQKLLKRGDFDKMIALRSHRKVLQNQLERTRSLITTIDRTTKYLQGRIKMQEDELYVGFNKEKHDEYVKELIDRFGDQAKIAIAESEKNVKNWTKRDWEKSKTAFDAICKKLVHCMKKGLPTSSNEVQTVIEKHYKWLKQFWTPTKKSYAEHGHLIVDSDLRKPYEEFDKDLPTFTREAIQLFAKNRLQ